MVDPQIQDLMVTREDKWFSNRFRTAHKTYLPSKWSNPRCWNTLGSRIRIQSPQSCLSEELMTSPEPTTGPMQSPTPYVANTIRGFARDWLFATVEMLDWEPQTQVSSPVCNTNG